VALNNRLPAVGGNVQSIILIELIQTSLVRNSPAMMELHVFR